MANKLSVSTQGGSTMTKNEKETNLVASFSSSTVADVEYDIIKEFNSTIDSMEKSLDESDTDSVKDKFPYLRFLVNDLEGALSGDFENLRYRRFITKKTG